MKILVVDDSKAMRMIVMRTLRQAGFGEHTIEEAGNGVEALKNIEGTPADLILCDWNMPEMNGIDLLKKLREAGNGVKFGFVTSEGNPEMRQIATDAGAAFLITKPFTVDAFQSALQPVLTG
ncbi:MAG: response regulator [Planctomycetes bacterium]|nr:response regulator [Planctomycetota bacterium]MCC7172969.1 response regulator [Planctomycetota bacterium]